MLAKHQIHARRVGKLRERVFEFAGRRRNGHDPPFNREILGGTARFAPGTENLPDDDPADGENDEDDERGRKVVDDGCDCI